LTDVIAASAYFRLITDQRPTHVRSNEIEHIRHIKRSPLQQREWGVMWSIIDSTNSAYPTLDTALPCYLGNKQQSTRTRLGCYSVASATRSLFTRTETQAVSARIRCPECGVFDSM